MAPKVPTPQTSASLRHEANECRKLAQFADSLAAIKRLLRMADRLDDKAAKLDLAASA